MGISKLFVILAEWWCVDNWVVADDVVQVGRLATGRRIVLDVGNSDNVSYGFLKKLIKIDWKIWLKNLF